MLCHGKTVNSLYEQLETEIEYAKKAIIPRTALYECHGRIKMARQLEAITVDEYLKLNTECVCNGINNPKYF